ncbi:hypothetical protein [Dongia deserti]|nr:hypothetical protein [Dongia deserti]
MDTAVTWGDLAVAGLVVLAVLVLIGVWEWLTHNPNGPGVE